MGLVMKNKICLNTQTGQSEIQLLFGDITQLPHEDKVDFVFISAFPGDYAPVPGTMIGALSRNLNLKVGEVAKDKAMDLRQSFNCWVSKPLPDCMPYHRLVCFERADRFERLAEKLAQQISGIFRAMMPVFNNQDTSVITPLLASGNQGHSETSVLRAIVSAACHWVKAGLPLRCLKIVIYAKSPHAYSQSAEELCEVFKTLKTKWEDKHTTEVTKVEKTIDVCLSFCAEDEDYIEQVCKGLLQMHGSMVIYRERFDYDHASVWQEKIFEVMVNSRKIIAILTPNYVEKPECLEQFNLALCCNRLTGEEVLAPFYIKTVDNFPSYMTLIQYTECRVRKPGEKEEEKIFTACCMLIKDLEKEQGGGGGNTDTKEDIDKVSGTSVTSDKTNNGLALTTSSVPASVSSSSSSSSYDIFISYSHKSPTEAHKFYENLLDIDPNLRIFLDRSELRTGNSWQEALYEAVDNAKVVVVFISETYVQSTVCQEEYNIALARYMSSDSIYLLPLLTSKSIKELPAMFSAAPLIDISEMVYEEDRFSIAEAAVKWLETLKAGCPILNRFRLIDPAKKTRIPLVTTRWRGKNFSDHFTLKKDHPGFELKSIDNADVATDQQTTTSSPPKTVVFSFAQDCSKQATVLSRLLQEEGQGKVSCEFLTPMDKDGGVQAAPKLQLLDSADMIVLMVSDDYLESVQHQHELHISLCRQRTCKDQRVVYLIEAYHIKREPVYAHLLHYSVSLGDELWAHLARKIYRDQAHVCVGTLHAGVPQIHCNTSDYLALYASTLDIVDKLRAEKTDGGNGMPCNIVNLVNLKETPQDPVPVTELLIPFSSLVEERPSHESSEVTRERPVVSRTKSSKQTEGGSEVRQVRHIVRSSQSCQVL